MGLLNSYILKRAATSIGGLIVFACCVLLMERLLRIFEIVSNSTDPALDAASMIVNLLPYYLGMAVPMALLLGTIITIDRLSKSSELTAALGAGVSLFHMTRPFLWLALGLAIITFFIEGYAQPVGRYKYRQVVNTVKQQSFTAALREGTFTTVGDQTFYAGTDSPDGSIGPIFIYEKLEKKGMKKEAASQEELRREKSLSRLRGFQENKALAEKHNVKKGVQITTAHRGEIIVRDATKSPILALEDGHGFQIFDAKLSGQLEFEGSVIAGAAGTTQYRARGEDEREMTSLELFKNRTGQAFPNVARNMNNATLHLRLAKTALLLILPFIAVPFGLNYGRNPSSAGIFIGVVFLVSLQKALEAGQAMGADGKIAPWLGVWGIIAIVAIFAAIIFWKTAFKMGQPPLTSFAQWLGHIKGEILSAVKSPFNRKSHNHV